MQESHVTVTCSQELSLLSAEINALVAGLSPFVSLILTQLRLLKTEEEKQKNTLTDVN